MSRYELLHGDCLEKLKGLPDNSVDAVVCDPPAGIAFMGRSWDEDKGGRREWVAWLASIMSECLRVLKPGGHALVWALPRTSHWTATALEDAGFEVKDCVVHIFGSGFPKSHNISKAIDKMKGADRPVIGLHPNPQSTKPKTSMGDGWQPSPMLTAPATPEAAQWEGFGSALKPASEHWWLCRKPLTGTIAANVLEWGTGGINVDACRVGAAGGTKKGTFPNQPSVTAYGNGLNGACEITPINAGRFPPNVLFSHLPECRQVGTKVAQRSLPTTERKGTPSVSAYGDGLNGQSTAKFPETVEAWECADGCAVRQLDEQSGKLASSFRAKRAIDLPAKATYGLNRGDRRPCGFLDSGGASRFFPAFRYQAKASRRERDEGLNAFPTKDAAANMNTRCVTCGRLKLDHAASRCACAVHVPAEQGSREGVKNNHPCVKPLSLMQWLVRLVTPPNGVVLDPFTGSGTTGVAAILEGFRFIGCEREDEYYAIAKARLDNAVAASSEKPEKPGKQGTLFDMEET